MVTTPQELKKVSMFLKECPSVTAKVLKAKKEGTLYGALVEDYLNTTAKVVFKVKNGKILWKCSCGGMKGRYPCHHLIAAIKYFKQNKKQETQEATTIAH
ncbi:SWIM zinc finger family protein [Desulfurobacterium sp. TC5-1]|uniref:SWIM zinc finger family protein n=1 Tax=Desulfurobacterium sp. TC5-1 TaxID=1158318 RepID=UPI0003B34A2A|nr:SWIM zinc finger family protein [Desulfurobacterium sp. TC5-1]